MIFLCLTTACVKTCLLSETVKATDLQESLSVLILDELMFPNVANVFSCLLLQGQSVAWVMYLPLKETMHVGIGQFLCDDVETLKKLILHNPYILTLPEVVENVKDDIIPKNVQQFYLLLLRSMDGADLEWAKEVKENVYDMVVEGFQLLSRWTGCVWEQCAWKFSRPCKDPISSDSHEIALSYSNYEKVVQYNYSAEERKVMVELVSYIKGIGLLL